MSNLKIDVNDLIKLVNEKVSMTNVLNKINKGNHYTVGRPCFCPFHDNTNTPAAVIYNNDGKETLYCFSEQKLYTPSDLVKTVLNKDVYQLGSAIWQQMSEYEQSAFLESINKEVDISSFDAEQTDEDLKLFNNKLAAFKYGKLSYNGLMAEYLKTLTK